MIRVKHPVAQWETRRDKLRQVKSVLFNSPGLRDKEGEAFRSILYDVTRIRLILLGASLPDAEGISNETISFLERWRSIGEMPAPRLGEYKPNWPAESRCGSFFDVQKRKLVEDQWDIEGQILQMNAELRIHHYLYDELRAFPVDPPPDPFLNTHGDEYEHEPERLKPPEARINKELTIQVIEEAFEQTRYLLDLANSLVVHSQHKGSEPEVGHYLSDIGDYAAHTWEQLREALIRTAYVPELSEQLATIRTENYSIGPIINTSVHETVNGISQLLWERFRSAIIPEHTPERERWQRGPWQGHEVKRSFPKFRETNSSILKLLESTTFQAIEADLRRESGQLLERCKKSQSLSGAQHKVILTPDQQQNSDLPSHPWKFFPDGTIVHVEAFGINCSLSMLKGTATLLQLLKQPNKPVPMLELLRDKGVDVSREASLILSQQEVADEQTLKELNKRMNDLDLDLERAQRDQDHALLDRASQEKEQLLQQVSAARGHGGRPRSLNSFVVKWRSAVSSRLKTVYSKLENSNPQMDKLAHHLRESIRSEGNAFVYRPSDPSIRWQIEK
ncbi:MAG: hypothetical protein QM703_19335 [Gemmatales bacterium]